ncbi:SPL family radical SAM protein [Peredibacter sp. HCB2-198]|uniref:SPL family radical SAM protein n=1 Tax=Peredibacter sp. HCB2-198 TaxID=3383025 RepID=UPI0038B63F08
MWNEIYVEEDIKLHPRVTSILGKLKKEPLYLERYDDIWGRSKKPYLQKRDSLNLFLARKKGQLLKEAPDAYGSHGEPHYYFIHAYNCIYECQYCYLQGYFNTPDIVLFINHEEIMQEMEEVLKKHPGQKVWFHAGEFSDSLALTHLTGELELYHGFCERNPNAIIELRTKSVNVREIEKLKPLPNLIVSFSLSPSSMARRVDLKTPSADSRVKAMGMLKSLGFHIAAHFDPIVYEDNFKETYTELLQQMKDLNGDLKYLSLGVVRFTKDVYREVERNYPESVLHTGPMIKSFDGKVRYHRPMRMWLMNSIKELAITHGVRPESIYLCMEENA